MRVVKLLIGVALVFSLGACSSMGLSSRQKSVAVGTVLGGVAGAVLTDSALGIVGGAAVGGIIGANR
ncbi:MAG: hypothetical protein KGK15_15160 [Burkholderiales bacterium]|nr:hypothetical protein [Burkholderiales bacterium]MDE2289597.1 hypothetical protein [Burkholderiales bacterium]MDE2610233.1 hypothetical protein [Burkholderiales bacterium]